jgi:LemA protein
MEDFLGYAAIALLALLIFYVIYLYNNIIRKNNNTEKAFGTIDVMLRKRYDLIPNLVEIVKQYMIHEEHVLTEITNLRAMFTDNLSDEGKVDLYNNISKKMNGILLSVENYPDLKASQNFIKLQASWNEMEEQISASRRYFNSAVTEYNNAIQYFPGYIIANLHGYKAKRVFEIDEEQRANISAKKLFN